MSQGQPNKFTRDQGAWHWCGRCGDRVPLKDLRWQREKLLDNKCFDEFPLLGDIDKAIAVILGSIIDSPDMQPDPKLTTPSLDAGDNDIFI